MNNVIENRLNGFISYSHVDVKAVVELKSKLEEFVSNRKLELWYDREINVGTKWKPEIEEKINKSDILVFCVTKSFLQSKSCRDEFRKAIELKCETYAEIIPIILEACEWESEEEISSYQATPDYGKPVASFESIEEAYNQIRNVLVNKIDIVSRRKKLAFTDAYNDELQSMDPLLTVSGSEHLNLKLDDVYVDLELNDQRENGNDSKPIQGAELVSKLINGEGVLLSGDSQSGKTSLSKNVCTQLFSKCHYPVYMSGKEAYQGDATKMVDRIIRNQYTDPECIDPKRIVLILDDFHKCRHFEKFLAGLPKCRSILLVFDDVYSLNLRNTIALKEYHPFVILPLRARKRNELIKKWLVANKDVNYNHGPFDNYKSHDRLVTHVESTLGKMFGRGLIPAYPFYILSILITSETAVKPLNQEISSQGYCYQVLLYAVLWRVGVRNQHMDMYVNVLTELAYMLFKKTSAKKCDEEDLNEFVKEYTKKFNLPVSPKQIFDNLERAKVFGTDGLGYYDFHYPYLKFYFIAKYMAEHYDDCDADFERVFSNLGNAANGYIAIFVAHHERSVHYLDRISEKTSQVFSGVTGCYLSNADMREFDEQSKVIVRAALPSPDTDPDRERERLLIEKERIERTQSDLASTDDDIAEPELRDFVIAVRLCQVLGQILKIRPASIPIDVQKKMIRSIIDAYSRILRLFFDTFKDKASQDAIIDYISHTLGSRLKNTDGAESSEKIRRKAEQIFWNLNFATTYGLMIHCVCAIGSAELVSIIKVACSEQENAPLVMIIPYVVEVIFKKKVDIDGMKKIFPDLSETVRNMLRFVVVYFCRTHHVTYKERQQVEQLFGLKKPLLPLYIEVQKEKVIDN